MTFETTKRERERLLACLARHVGADNGADVQGLALAVYGREAGPSEERRIRKLVVELREDGHHVCAHPSAGYYMAENDAELNQTCKFLYSRAMCSLKQVAAMRRVSLPDLAGQLKIRLEDPSDRAA